MKAHHRDFVMSACALFAAIIWPAELTVWFRVVMAWCSGALLMFALASMRDFYRKRLEDAERDRSIT